MSVKVMSAVFECPFVAGNDKLVLLIFANFADDHGGNIFPSKTTVAKMSGLSERQVFRICQDLESRGFLDRMAAPQGHRVRYRLPVERLTEPLSNCHPCQIVTPDMVSGLPLTFTTQTPDMVSCNPLRTTNKPPKAKKVLPEPEWTEGMDCRELRDGWRDWVAHRKEIKKPLTAKAVSLQVKKLEGLGKAVAIATLTHSVECGYQGLFPPREQSVTKSQAVGASKLPTYEEAYGSE